MKKPCTILKCRKAAYCRGLCTKHYSSLRTYGNPLKAKTYSSRAPVLPGQEATHRIWSGLKNRCLNPKNKDYGRYGGRGITVAERWLVFANFVQDMGLRPPGMTVERKDNEKGYWPGNCRWATRKEQGANRASNIALCLDGKRTTLPLACASLGVNPKNARARLRRGWPVERALESSRVTQA